MAHKILIADDDEGILSALSLLLKSEGFTPVTAESPEQVLTVLRKQEFSLILMDLNYSLDTTSGEEGLELIASIRRLDESIPIVVMTGWGTIELAVDAMKIGANDFIQKPWENDRLLAIVRNQVKLADIQRQSQKLIQQNQLLQREINPTIDVISESNAIKEVINTIKQVAKSDVSVLFTGENGTGKSMFARYLHNLSPRRESPLISVNMGAVTESLFESEMFGHEKGAFTDAKASRIGRFELADGGTLFLDEIGNTPYSQQGKLLRVLEENRFERVGSSRTQSIDFRLITATNSNLNKVVSEGKFRKDLLYRINTVEVEIPPLRKRVEDIIPLANAFLIKIARKYSTHERAIDDAAQAMLKSYHWPGNVRELSHVMERAHIFSRKSVIRPQNLGLDPSVNHENNSVSEDCVENDFRPIDEIEMDIIDIRLLYFDNDVSKTAKSLGLSRSALYRRIGKLKK